MAGFRLKQKFTVYINEGEKHQIHEWVKRYPNIETGGDLFGAWIDDHTAVVQFVLGPGNNCRRTGVSFYQDVDYLRDAGSFLTQQHGLCNIGQWHSHHQLGLTRPSGGDENTVWSNMPKLGLNRYIVFIATITGGSRSYFGYGDYYGSSSNEGLNVNINPYLFEIKHGRRMDVLHGSFEFMKYNSPFRLNEAITDIVQIGAEVMNRIKRYEITVEKNRKRSHIEMLTESTEPEPKQLKPKEKEEGENVDTSLTEHLKETSKPTALTTREDHKEKQPDSMDVEEDHLRNNSAEIISGEYDDEKNQDRDDDDTSGQSRKSNIPQNDAERNLKQNSDEGSQNHSVTKSERKNSNKAEDQTEHTEHVCDVSLQAEQSRKSNIGSSSGAVSDEQSDINPTTHEEKSKEKQPGTAVSEELLTTEENKPDCLKSKPETEQDVDIIIPNDGNLVGDHFADEKSMPTTHILAERKNEEIHEKAIDVDTDNLSSSKIQKEKDGHPSLNRSKTEGLNSDDTDESQVKTVNGEAVAGDGSHIEQITQPNIQQKEATENKTLQNKLIAKNSDDETVSEGAPVVSGSQPGDSDKVVDSGSGERSKATTLSHDDKSKEKNDEVMDVDIQSEEDTSSKKLDREEHGNHNNQVECDIVPPGDVSKDELKGLSSVPKEDGSDSTVSNKSAAENFEKVTAESGIDAGPVSEEEEPTERNVTSTLTSLTKREDHKEKQRHGMDIEQDPPQNNTAEIISGDHDDDKHQGKNDNDPDGESGQSNILKKDTDGDLKQESDECFQNHSVTKKGMYLANSPLEGHTKNSHGNDEDTAAVANEEQNGASRSDKETLSNREEDHDTSKSFKVSTADKTEFDERGDEMNEEGYIAGIEFSSPDCGDKMPSNVKNVKENLNITKHVEDQNHNATFNYSYPENSCNNTQVKSMDVDGQNSADSKATDLEGGLSTDKDTEDQNQNSMTKLQSETIGTTVENTEELEEEGQQPKQMSENQPKTPGLEETSEKQINDSKETKSISQENMDDSTARQKIEEPVKRNQEKNQEENNTKQKTTIFDPLPEISQQQLTSTERKNEANKKFEAPKFKEKVTKIKSNDIQDKKEELSGRASKGEAKNEFENNIPPVETVCLNREEGVHENQNEGGYDVPKVVKIQVGEKQKNEARQTSGTRDEKPCTPENTEDVEIRDDDEKNEQQEERELEEKKSEEKQEGIKRSANEEDDDKMTTAPSKVQEGGKSRQTNDSMEDIKQLENNIGKREKSRGETVKKKNPLKKVWKSIKKSRNIEPSEITAGGSDDKKHKEVKSKKDKRKRRTSLKKLKFWNNRKKNKSIETSELTADGSDKEKRERTGKSTKKNKSKKKQKTKTSENKSKGIKAAKKDKTEKTPEREKKTVRNAKIKEQKGTECET